MSDMCFPILGSRLPSAVGRQGILDKMKASLIKPVPDHLQVTGARFAGKTVLLHELVDILRHNKDTYSAVFIWDLGHQTPSTDEQFLQVFAQNLAIALKENHPDYAEHLRTIEGNPYHVLSEILVALEEENTHVLVIMDGFDKPLENGKLTRNLWDQLRELALIPSLRLVTASRRRLRELIRHPDSQTSDFWNIFNPTPVHIGCFDENDLNILLRKLPERKFESGAVTELLNESNGYPVLILGILNAINDLPPSETVSSNMVRVAASHAVKTLRDQLGSLWNDCPSSSKDLFLRVKDNKSVLNDGVALSDIERLLERGFVHQVANKIQRPCRLLIQYLEYQPNESNALIRLFGSPDAYILNTKSVFERRIAHIDGIDSSLKHYLERAIGDLPTHPDVFMTNIRGIVDCVFELIWRTELPNKTIPASWISYWENNQEKVDSLKSGFPQGGKRVLLLKLMTGTEKSLPRAKKISKTTFVMVNSAQAFGDFGQHQQDSIIDNGTAYAVFLLCLELVASVTREVA